MIHTKIKKGKAEELLVEFSKNHKEWPTVVSNFYDTCKDQNIKTNESPHLKPEIIRFYTVDQVKPKRFHKKQVKQMLDASNPLKQKIQQIQLKFTVIYMNQESKYQPNYDDFKSQQNQAPRVLLLRQTLEPFYDLNFEVESTLSSLESIIYLCSLAASLINSKNQGQIEEYQQKKDLMIRRGNEGQLNSTQVIWRNILYQVPGLGKDKVKVIADNFPTYKKLIADIEKSKKLQNLQTGTKGIKIGAALAQRLYKVFGSLNGKQKLY